MGHSWGTGEWRLLICLLFRQQQFIPAFPQFIQNLLKLVAGAGPQSVKLSNL
jgi:hypothetical protein